MPHRHLVRRLIAGALCCAMLFPAATALHADDITSAQAQLKQDTAARLTAQQRLAAAKQEVANLNLQLQANRAELIRVQQTTAALEQRAGARQASLTKDRTALLADLQAARARLATQQQQFATQQAAAQARLQSDLDDLRSAQGQLRSADRQHQQLEADASALTAQLQTMDADIAAKSGQIAAVLVQMYKLSQTSAVSLVLESSSVSDGLSRLTMLGMVSQHDQDLMRQLANERDLAHRQHDVLASDLAATEQLEGQLDAERQEISLRTTDETGLIRDVEDGIAKAQASFALQAATLDRSIQATEQQLAANQQQLVASRAPLLVQAATLATARQGATTHLFQAEQQQASAEQQIAQAERDQEAATALIQQLQAAAARAAAAERAREAAAAAAQQAAGRAAARQMSAPLPNGFIWPLQGSITQGFGPTSWLMEPPGDGYAHFHTGVDIAAAYGAPIRAAAAGIVIHTGWFSGGNWGYGNCIIIVHNSTISTLYGHLSGYAVAQGQYVQQGQVIGYEGSTGNSSGPHLHFEVRVNGNAVSPYGYI